MSQALCFILLSVVASGCCGVMEPTSGTLGSSLNLKPGMSKDEAKSHLSENGFTFYEDGREIIGSRPAADCIAYKGFFRCVITFDEKGRLQDYNVYDVKIPA